MASSDGGGPVCMMGQAHFTSALDRISLHLHPFPSFPSIPRMKDSKSLPSEGVGSLLFNFLGSHLTHTQQLLGCAHPLTTSKCVAPSSSSSPLPPLKCLSPYCVPQASLPHHPLTHAFGVRVRALTHTSPFPSLPGNGALFLGRAPGTPLRVKKHPPFRAVFFPSKN
jgi:hypothetical protein